MFVSRNTWGKNIYSISNGNRYKHMTGNLPYATEAIARAVTILLKKAIVQVLYLNLNQMNWVKNLNQVSVFILAVFSIRFQLSKPRRQLYLYLPLVTVPFSPVETMHLISLGTLESWFGSTGGTANIECIGTHHMLWRTLHLSRINKRFILDKWRQRGSTWDQRAEIALWRN